MGDLVVVLRAHEHSQTVGKHFTVSQIKHRGVECGACSWKYVGLTACFQERPGEFSLPVEWLKRIPPLEELEGERTQEDIREPA